MNVLQASLSSVMLLSLLSSPSVNARDAVHIVANSSVAVVSTDAGRVQGFQRQGIFTFRGIAYATAERFQAPVRVKAWEGIRPALSYGNICPQPVSPQLNEPQTFIADTRFWPAAENCQNLNVWTTGLGDAKKRPVMFWIHGGGFFSGSSMELPIYDGTNLSRKGDVVVVSINHRLNVLGFLDLSAYGDAYHASANAGMLDIVAALGWVRDNIAAFGGDPANITVFGQSGGGAKVATLLAAPKARGLFHKAIIQSGAPGSVATPYARRDVARRVAELTLQEAGLSQSRVDELRNLPYDQLIAAANRALLAVTAEIKAPPGITGRFPISWNPVVDGDFLPEAPFADGAPGASRGIPLLIGSTLSEFQNFPNPALARRSTWSEEDAAAYVRTAFGDSANAVIAAYRGAYPDYPAKLWPLIDTMFRSGVLRTARLKAAQGDTVYSYLFAWRSPVLDYAWAAGHSSELAFTFNNADLGAQSSGGGPVVERLTDEISSAWINFARTGNPNGPRVAAWPRFERGREATLIFDEASSVRIGHDADLIRLLAK